MMNDRSLEQIKNRIKKAEEETQGLKKNFKNYFKREIKKTYFCDSYGK